MDVSVFLEPKLDMPRLIEILDGLGHEGRVHAVHTWNKHRQAAIFEAAKDNGPLTIDYFVGPHIAPKVEVATEGMNTMPMFTWVRKHFAKTSADATELVGYNNIPPFHMSFSGPGYFMARNDEAAGEVLVDYERIPTDQASLPAGWPKIVPNSGLPLRGVVYGTMVDRMRKVSKHVSIGRASKGGKLMDVWFTIVRKDVD